MPLLGNPPVGRPLPQTRGTGFASTTLGLKPDTSVGVGTSSVPYGPTNGYANPNGVTGFIGPAASSLRQPTSWYVRIGGSNDNGGSSSSLSPERTGSDATITAQSVLTSATANFTPADIGKGICIGTGSGARRFKIVGYTNATTVTLTGGLVASSAQWAIGGAWADLRAAVADSAITTNAVGGVQAGDFVYVGAGTYRAVITVGSGAASGVFSPAFNGQVNIVGDVTGQYTGDAGQVQLTGYTTNDKTAPSSGTLLAIGSKSNLAFSNIVFVTGSAATNITASSSQNVAFTDCAFYAAVGASGIASLTSAYLMRLNWVFDRCVFLTGRTTAGGCIVVTATSGAASDYDVNVLLRNCVFLNNGTAISVAASGAGAGKGNGVRAYGCSFILCAAMTSAAVTSTTFPSKINGCLVFTGNITAAMTANTLGQIVEDYNIITATTPRTNVTAGTHSISDNSYAPLFHYGQERLWGGLLRPLGEPTVSSPLLGFDPTGGGGPDTAPAVDFYNRFRPAGSATPVPAIGAFERGNTAAQGTTPAPTAGTHVWTSTGPWQQDFLMPVAAAADGFSIQVQRDASYSFGPNGSNPTLEILANPTIGVAYQKITDTGSTGAWNTLAAAAFTPTAVGWVTVRITSYDASGASVVAFAVANPT